MPDQNVHIIQKQQVQLKVGQKENTLALQQRFERMIQEQLLPRLEPLFDQLAGPDVWIEIDRLDINLGQLKPGLSDAVWLEQLYQAYIKALDEQIQKPAIQQIAREEQVINTLAFFLERGYFPWWVETFDLEAAVRKIIPTQAGRILDLLQSPVARKRWVRQFGKLTQDRLFQVILEQYLLKKGGRSIDLNETLIPLEFWRNHFSELTDQKIKNIYWETLWNAIWQTETVTARLGMSLFSEFLKALPGDKALHKIYQLFQEQPLLSDSAKIEFPFSIKQLKAILPAEKAKRIFWTAFREASFIPKGYHHSWTLLVVRQILLEWPDDSALIKLDRLIQTAPGLKADFKRRFGSALRQFVEDETYLELRKLVSQGGKPASALKPSLEKILDQYFPASSDLPEKKRPASRKVVDEQGIFVALAGIVLIHPFLPAFFEALDLLERGQFRDEVARERALHLLYFLATGLEHPQEQEVVLLKLLCGIKIETPIERELYLSKSEKEEALELLQAVIGEWKAMEGGSPDDLRATFFIREGKLKPGEMGWYLTVEVKTFDILLGKLPWGLSPVMHSWMKHMLWVDWG